jgi:hypothetical protein
MSEGVVEESAMRILWAGTWWPICRRLVVAPLGIFLEGGWVLFYLWRGLLRIGSYILVNMVYPSTILKPSHRSDLDKYPMHYFMCHLMKFHLRNLDTLSLWIPTWIHVLWAFHTLNIGIGITFILYTSCFSEYPIALFPLPHDKHEMKETYPL